MAKIKISELFYSLQGEGQYVGVPSVFLRTFGCNFTCGGFGMPRGKYSIERDNVAEQLQANPLKFKDYKELPLVSTGCDSYASWDPRFKHLSPMLTIEAIINRMQELLPGGTFGRDKHLIITGGEPLLGWQKSFPELLDEIRNRNMNLTHLTFETNGTQKLSNDFHNYLHDLYMIHGVETTFSISAKLPSSGEVWKEAICPDVVAQYIKIPGHRSYFKFVVSEAADIYDAVEAVKEYKAAGIDIPVYLMPVGGVNSVYEMNERNVADFCRDSGFRFSPRIQVPLYKNAWNT
jgi:organic radical activating enzyme